MWRRWHWNWLINQTEADIPLSHSFNKFNITYYSFAESRTKTDIETNIHDQNEKPSFMANTFLNFKRHWLQIDDDIDGLSQNVSLLHFNHWFRSDKEPRSLNAQHFHSSWTAHLYLHIAYTRYKHLPSNPNPPHPSPSHSRFHNNWYFSIRPHLHPFDIQFHFFDDFINI